MLLKNLESMTPEQLRQFAGTQGVKVHWNAKPETVIKAIMDKVASPVRHPNVNPDNVEQTKITQLMAKRLQDAADAAANTPEMVEEAIAHIKAKRSEFVSKYDPAEDTWEFSCLGAVESGNIAIPLRRIVRQAELVSRGRLVPRGLNQHFDTMNSATGKNAYTNTVLVG